MMPCNIYVMSKTNAINETIIQLIVALSEFSLQYVHVKAVKGQSIVVFLADHHCVDTKMITYARIRPWRVHFDGFKYQGCERMSRLKICFD